MDKTKEVRYLTADSLEVRVDDDRPVIEGHAAVFDEEAVIGDYFREVIKPGAFTRAIKEKQDVRALWNHDANHVLGRTKAGTLHLSEDKRGLKIAIDPPDTQFANDLLTSIKRGDIDQMSFAFRAVEEKWIEKKGEMSLRELHDLDLYDISPVTYPAYAATDVGLRSSESVYQDHVQSLEGQEPEGDDAKRAEAQEREDAQRVMDLIRLQSRQ